jgi:hypothetical protein
VGGSSSPRQSRPLHPLPESPFLPMLCRNPPAVVFLRQMPEPVLDMGDEPLGGDQIPDGMVIVRRLTVAENGVGHLAIEQDGSYRVIPPRDGRRQAVAGSRPHPGSHRGAGAPARPRYPERSRPTGATRGGCRDVRGRPRSPFGEPPRWLPPATGRDIRQERPTTTRSRISTSGLPAHPRCGRADRGCRPSTGRYSRARTSARPCARPSEGLPRAAPQPQGVPRSL